MDRTEGKSADVLHEKIVRLGKIFPECLTEMRGADGKLKLAFDVDKLKDILSDRLPDVNEAYQFTWVGKNAARAEAYRRIDKTLRPCVEESVDWNETRNLYIEGDNLDVLKLLQQSYMNKVKLIYIDPPYNTGRNYIYRNRFDMDKSEYAQEIELCDEGGNKNFVENSESNPRFHSDWCSMMYARLLLARNLLTDDGAIFIAIDDNEIFNLKKICDEVFGSSNFIGTIVTRCNPQGRNKNNIDPVHEYHLVFAKSVFDMPLLRLKKLGVKAGEYRTLLRGGANSRKMERPHRFYPILAKGEKVFMIKRSEYEKIYLPPDGFDESFIEELRKRYESEGFKFILPVSKNGEEKVWQRTFDRVSREYSSYICRGDKIEIPEELDRTPISLWSEDRYSNVSNGTGLLKEMFSGAVPFNFPKSIYTVKDMTSLLTDTDDIVLDFFSGSATTAHAVMQLNAEDGGNRRFIMVQLPELCAPNSEAAKAGYKNICEIGKKRIRLAGQQIKDAAPLTTGHLDVGFRVFKLDESNFKNVFFNVEEITQESLESAAENIKSDRTPLDLLFGCLLDWGVELNLPYTSETFNGATIHDYAEDALIACFDKALDESVIEYIAKKKPLRAVFRDSSFSSDAAKLNAVEIFKLHSQNTNVKVI